MKRSHVVISMLISLMGIGYSTGAASAFPLIAGEGPLDRSLAPEMNGELLWLAQASSNLTVCSTEIRLTSYCSKDRTGWMPANYAGAIAV